MYISVKLYLYFYLILVYISSGRRIGRKRWQAIKPNFFEFDNPIMATIETITGSQDGRREENFGGGNIGAYYNFMYPDNTDYPWACICNIEDFKLWVKKEQPYVRCLNQEDLSYQDIQANCDPKNVANYQKVDSCDIF